MTRGRSACASCSDWHASTAPSVASSPDPDLEGKGTVCTSCTEDSARRPVLAAGRCGRRHRDQPVGLRRHGGIGRTAHHDLDDHAAVVRAAGGREPHRKFNKTYPGGGHVSIDWIGGEPYKQKIAVAMAGHKPPAIFLTYGGELFEQYVKAGDVADLSPALGQGHRLEGAVRREERLRPGDVQQQDLRDPGVRSRLRADVGEQVGSSTRRARCQLRRPGRSSSRTSRRSRSPALRRSRWRARTCGPR